MLLFRSEEDLDTWTAATGIDRGEAFDLGRLWALARSWYADRLDRDWQRRSVAERQSLLEAAGLTGDFWAIEPPAWRRRVDSRRWNDDHPPHDPPAATHAPAAHHGPRRRVHRGGLRRR